MALTLISNCGVDEKGGFIGGKAGDQTGREYCVRNWYSHPWQYVLRYPDEKVGAKIASIAKAAANNNAIGYDQGERGTYYIQLVKASYKPSKIRTACEADCSSSTAANVIATGMRLGIEKLTKVSPYCTTRNLREALIAAGFKCYKTTKLTNSCDYLLPGDILLTEGQHVAINITAGDKVKKKKAVK